MPPKDIPYRNRLLTSQIASNRVAMVDTLLKARTRIENKILRAAKDKRFATVRRYREGILKDIQMEYVRLNGDLDQWSKGSVLRTSKAFHALAVEDLLLTDDDKSVISFTKFSKKHNEDYFNRISPFNADRLAAVNSKLSSMASTDVNALRSAVVNSFREAQVAGMTSSERWRLLQSQVLEYADDPKSWQFIDKAGRKWKRGNYFNMVNRTVSAQTANQAYTDTLIDEGRDLVQIQGGLSSNSADACIKWVGKVVSLTGETSGFPTLQEYKDDGGFHPNCVHYTVYMSPKFEKTASVIEEQRGDPAPTVDKPATKPVVKMKNADVPTVQKDPKIQAMNRSIDKTRASKIETLQIFDNDGTLIHKDSQGKRGEVKVTFMDKLAMRNRVAVHNHPNGSSFSKEDVDVFATARPKRMIAVTKDKTYIVTGEPPDLGASKIASKAYDKANREVNFELGAKRREGLSHRELTEWHTDKVMRLIDKDVPWINYRVERL